ncbi:MAG: beta-galactosidase [Clostridia bacterium]|nr:beta-galactosidase [Clostridia bacterium]
MFKKYISVIVVMAMLLSLSACDKKQEEISLPEYDYHEFELVGLWAPRQMTEEAFLQYKDAGFNVMSFTNHDEEPRSSENQYYLGSKRTEEALKLCKKVGLDVYLTYGNTWFVRDIEGRDYFGETPFSKHDYYDEYKDIIKGVHIKDEPHIDDMDAISNDTIIKDFEKVYPNAKYMVNIVSLAAGGEYYGYTNYYALFDDYMNSIVKKLDNPYISLDLYPFHNITTEGDKQLAASYDLIARAAKETGASTTMIMQASTGVEFHEELSEGDMRWQVYSALAFGAHNIQYYCYSKPEGRDYNCCMLMPDNKTPSYLYYYVQEINNEIQSMASAMLSYDWDKSIGISGTEDIAFRVAALEYESDLATLTSFKDAKNYVSAQGTQDMIVSRFVSEKYGESYMFVNFAEKEKANTVNAVFKDCSAIALYGGDGFDGTPKIVELNEDGDCQIELAYGDGVFVVPLK